MTTLLQASNLSKSYAGLHAVKQFSINLKRGEIHALIGPNGAGKSTAIGLLTGEVKLDEGEITFLDTDISALQTVQRARKGLGHTYQITSVINELSVTENMLIALLANTHANHIGLSRADSKPELMDQAKQNLQNYNLASAKDKLAGELSHGEQGRLEIAMCVATKPVVLLLDEPMSGMSLGDSDEMISILSQLKKSVAIMLVEHDMEAVFKLADRISVMASGEIIATGSPQIIRNHPQVIEAYLGHSDA